MLKIIERAKYYKNLSSNFITVRFIWIVYVPREGEKEREREMDEAWKGRECTKYERYAQNREAKRICWIWYAKRVCRVLEEEQKWNVEP